MLFTRTFKVGILLLLFVLVVSPGHAQTPPNAPTKVQAVPRYAGSITVVVTWQDNSNNEDNFEIQRREEGGAFSFLATVGANATVLEDVTATADKFWEYQVRARSASFGNSTWAPVSNRTSPRRSWPIKDGDHDILHDFGTPLNFSGNQYWHEGVDISASGKDVLAAHGGIIERTIGGKNGQVDLRIDVGGGATVTEYYAHIHLDSAISKDDVVAPGTRLGTVSDDHFGMAKEADHVHWGPTTRNPLNWLLAVGDRDPNQKTPQVADINKDKHDFIVVSASNNNHINPRDPAWGEVDFLVDAHDDMAANLSLNVAPYSLGYWIQSDAPGGGNVRSAASPYKLVQFDFPLLGPGAGRAWSDAAVYWPLDADLHSINTWQSTLAWIVTNSDDTDGAKANLDANQFWKTDLRTGTGTQPNGSDGDAAREIQEAKFPDGRYFVHILLNDFENQTDTIRDVVVDNFRPYVRALKVYSGATLIYASEWQWDSAAEQLAISPSTFDAASVFPASRTRDLNIEIEFSEPMTSAQVSSISPLGTTPTLTSDQPEHSRTLWKGTISNLDIADDGSDDGKHTITVAGTDLAGNSLLQVADRNSKGTNHNNRDAAGVLRGTAGSDSIHGFVIGGLEGQQVVTAIFVKTSATDPVTPTLAAKSSELANWLNEYYGEVTYNEISFQVAGNGWYQLSHSLNWYYQKPQTALVDLVQDALALATTKGVDLSNSDYVLVVTDETTARDEWSTSGAWPYTVKGNTKLMAAGVLNLASSSARVTHLAGRMVGLIDLFAYPEVTTARPFVGPWSHMSDKDTQVHFMGWEKWRAGWMDESGHATGVQVERVAKPGVSSPIANRDFAIAPLDEDSDDVKLVAIEIGDGLYYTAEYRRDENLDSALPAAGVPGVLIAKTNDLVAQGEGPVIVRESDVTANNLDDATFTTDNQRKTFNDVGSGVTIEVKAITNDEAQIRLNYAVPPFENDVYVSPHDNRWKTVDIWVDAPDLSNAFAADPRTVMNSNEKPVIGKVNKVIGRVRNKGAADATNFEVELEILEPWGSDGEWRSLTVATVALLQGSVNNATADYLIIADWTPKPGVHTCVKLRVRGVANDINEANNETQENITEFTTTPGSPYQPVVSQFQVKNPFSEELPFLFRVDGLPAGWTYSITPGRPVIAPEQTITAQITIQPATSAPLCTREEITLQVFVPRVDTLKRVGGITLAISLKNGVEIRHESWTDCNCDCPDQPAEQCRIYTRACTEPGVPNARVAVVYKGPDGTIQVHYVNTDEDGCFSDVLLTKAQPGPWETEVVLDETDCRGGARSRPVVIVVDTPVFDPCADYRMALIELTTVLGDAMRNGDVLAVEELHQRIQELLQVAQECDPTFERLIPLYSELVDAFFAGREDLVEQLLKEILSWLGA